MSEVINSATVIAIAYLLGSIPSAYIIGRLAKGIDIQKVGDGRIGASAAFHNVGALWGILVGFADFSKGAVAIFIAKNMAVSEPIVLSVGLAAIIGHDWSIFLHFEGGKGAATTWGVLAALMLQELLIAFSLVGVLFYFTRRSTLATAITLSSLPLLLFALPFTEASGLLVFYAPILGIPMFIKHLSMPKPTETEIRES